MIVVLKKHVSSAEWQGTWNILTKKNGYSILESDTGERHAAWTPYRQKGAGTDESKKDHPRTCNRPPGRCGDAALVPAEDGDSAGKLPIDGRHGRRELGRRDVDRRPGAEGTAVGAAVCVPHPPVPVAAGNGFSAGAGAEVWRLCKNRGLSAGHGPADRVLYRVSDPAVHGNLHRYFHPKALEADGPR